MRKRSAHINNLALLQCVVSRWLNQNRGYDLNIPAGKKMLGSIIAGLQNWPVPNSGYEADITIQRFVREVIGEEKIAYHNGRQPIDFIPPAPSPGRQFIPEQTLPQTSNRKKHRINKFYRTPEWIKLRYQILRLFGQVCMCCGATSEHKRIMVDHVRPRSLYPDLALDPRNMQVLCEDCNAGKGWDDESDWRTPEQIAALCSEFGFTLDNNPELTAAFKATMH